MPLRPRLSAVAAALLMLVVAACGSDEASSDPGEAVDGRAVETTAPDDSAGTETTADPDAAMSSESTTTEAPARRPLNEVAVTLTEVASVASPTKLVARPGSDLLYVAEQGGRVVTIDPSAGPGAEAKVALDLVDLTSTGGERGLLGLAFSPDGATLYVHHSGAGGGTQVSSYAMSGDGADPASGTSLLRVDQPFPNHNGGELLVGDDGLLWIGLGDGGSGGDPDDRAQDPDDLLGKVLRIDPTAPADGNPYGIPADNPFVGGGGRPEVVITGVRNPWRMRFDPASDDLWIADVGQDEIEEIDRIPADAILGANLGWSRFEGSATFDSSREIRSGPALGPVFEMTHGDGWCSVTGGPVYRGTAIPDLDGAYLFGDFCKKGLASIRLDGGEVAESAVLDGEVDQVVSIDTDADGEVYVLSITGSIFRLDPA